MRKVLIFCITLFIILAVIPLFTSYISSDKEIITINTKSTSVPKMPETDKELIIKHAADMCNEDFCDEGLKAVLAIAENNVFCMKSDGNNNSITSSTDYSEEFYERLEKLYNELDVNIKYNDKSVFIPTSSLSSGYINTSEEYPYIKAVASPWDTYQKEFVFGKEYPSGISVAGINYLCNEGESYKDALRWYLPDFDIK